MTSGWGRLPKPRPETLTTREDMDQLNFITTKTFAHHKMSSRKGNDKPQTEWRYLKTCVHSV
jgi:hypothetical protein